MVYEAKQAEIKEKEKIQRIKQREKEKNTVKSRKKAKTKYGEGIELSSDEEHDSD